MFVTPEPRLPIAPLALAVSSHLDSPCLLVEALITNSQQCRSIFRQAKHETSSVCLFTQHQASVQPRSQRAAGTSLQQTSQERASQMSGQTAQPSGPASAEERQQSRAPKASSSNPQFTQVHLKLYTVQRWLQFVP